MKKNIHPKYHEIVVAMTDGFEFKTRSAWGKEGDRLQLDVDPKTHPAWVGGVHLKKTGRIEKFNTRFANFDFTAGGGKTPESAPKGKSDKKQKDDKKAEKKAEGDAAA